MEGRLEGLMILGYLSPRYYFFIFIYIFIIKFKLKMRKKFMLKIINYYYT